MSQIIKFPDPILKVSVADLNKCLVCSICQGYLREAHTINECLHTFCKQCIFDYLRSGNKICPLINCSEPLGLNPYDKLIYDRNKQALVDKFFPHLLPKGRLQASISESSGINSHGVMQELAPTDKLKIKIVPDFVSFSGFATDLKLAKLVIQVQCSFKLQQLLHFIMKQINHPAFTEIADTRVQLKCRDRLLTDLDHTLADVYKHFWKDYNEDLEITYSLSPIRSAVGESVIL